MNERETILSVQMDVLGEEGCGVSGEEATVYQDSEGWESSPEGRQGFSWTMSSREMNLSA